MFAEWERQKGVVMIYPHRFCDFASDIKEVSAVFDQIIYEICKVENLFLILHPNDNALQRRIRFLRSESKYIKERCTTIYIPTNDVWARDTVIISKRGAYLDFGFNGWGMKFRADLDELISQNLAQKLDFMHSLETIDMILEGGSIDCNGNGLLLTNTTCLLHENRNPHLSQSEIEDRLKTHLCAQHVLWLKHGYLLGDDTDGHIDTLARFIDKDTICYVQSTDARESKMSQERQKEHRELAEMEYELQEIAKRYGLNLLPLPMCKYEYKGEPLPASYVNFLFLNDDTMLMPIYGKHTDALAQQRLRQALPDYRIIPINCEALIRQHGSLHCLTMQIH